MSLANVTTWTTLTSCNFILNFPRNVRLISSENCMRLFGTLWLFWFCALLILMIWCSVTLYFCIFLKFWFSAHAILCLQLADGVWPSFIKSITYLLTIVYLFTEDFLVDSIDGSFINNTTKLIFIERPRMLQRYSNGNLNITQAACQAVDCRATWLHAACKLIGHWSRLTLRHSA